MSYQPGNDERLVSTVLKRLAEAAPRHRELPEAHFLWVTASLMPDVRLQERALKPIGILQFLSHGVVALCWALLVTWKWPVIRSWFAAPDLRLFDALTGAGSMPLSFLILIGGLLCITSVVILHNVLAEE